MLNPGIAIDGEFILRESTGKRRNPFSLFVLLCFLVVVGFVAGCRLGVEPSGANPLEQASAVRMPTRVLLAPASKLGAKPEAKCETITARATRTETVLNKSNQRQWDPVCTDGTVRVDATMEVSGWPPLSHKEFHVAPGVTAPSQWDLSSIKLANGGTVLGNSLAYGGGWGSFELWNFLHLYGRGPGETKNVDLLMPSMCVGAASCDGEGWASSELVFDRPVSNECVMRLFVRIKRVAGDPYLYMLVSAEPKGGTVESLGLSGYPVSGSAVFYGYGMVYGYPQPAGFLTRLRYVWIAGHDWNMHDPKEKHEAAVAPGDPGGILCYNRENAEIGGMKVIFVPEEVSKTSAAGTYGVGATLGMKKPTLRLALLGWQDWRGAEVVRQEFIAELPARTQKLREMSFAWPVTDPLGPVARDHIRLVSTAQTLPEEARKALTGAMSGYEQALAKLAAVPATDTEERYALEREVIMRKVQVETALKPLQQEWVKQGGLF